MRPRLLDLFSGAGGAAVGYHRAGFEVIGVDIAPQPRFPFMFHQADALEFLAGVKPGEFDAIHASPPCQRFSAMRRGRWQDREHPDLLGPTRKALEALGTPYVIENVVGAPLRTPVLLCGTMFGLQTRAGNQLRRHRLFEAPWVSGPPVACQHNEWSAIGVYGGGQHPQRRYGEPSRLAPIPDGAEFGVKARREAMGIEWMTRDELSQAIPPAYTEWLGRQLIGALP